MKLAKQHVDVGLFTNNAEAMMRFWQGEVGLPFEETLPLGGGMRQQRHGMNGSVLKINDARDPLPEEPPAGYRELTIARPGLPAPRRLNDPDGNAVLLVPPGEGGVAGIGMRLAVADAAAFHNFYGRVLELEACGENAYRCGDSVLSFIQEAGVGRAGEMRARGYRYLTIQVWDVDGEHAGFLARGAEEGQPPRTLGSTARISFIRDPGGNWIEVSQRASLTGALPG
ncbi:MAG: VOC family protein [Chloroflexi bacterium]|nr:VOC family protein [Chloroflexota bacterium]